MAKCKCSWCKISKRLKKIHNKLNKKDQKFFTEFIGFHLDIAMENDYRKAILDGKWPESKEVGIAYDNWKKNRFKGLKR